jgi:hypothetical protein
MQLGGEEEVRREMRGLMKVVRCRWVAPSRLEKRGRRAQGLGLTDRAGGLQITKGWICYVLQDAFLSDAQQLMALSHCSGTVLLYGNRGMVHSTP